MADLLARLQVRAEPLGVRVQTAEVDDPGHLSAEGRGGESAGVRPVELLEASPGSQGVNEVVGNVHPAHRGVQAVGVSGVARDDLHLVVPRPVRQVPWLAGHHPNAEAGCQ